MRTTMAFKAQKGLIYHMVLQNMISEADTAQ